MKFGQIQMLLFGDWKWNKNLRLGKFIKTIINQRRISHILEKYYKFEIFFFNYNIKTPIYTRIKIHPIL